MRHHLTPYAIAIVSLLLGAVSAESQIRNIWGSTGNIVHVAKGGKGFRSIQAALDSITDASDDNPYLVSVAPGVYEEQVTMKMKEYVDIEGAGENLTRVTSSLKGAENAALRSLTVECHTVGGCLAIDGASSITNVTIRASGVYPTGIHLNSGKALLKDVTIEISVEYDLGCGGTGVLLWPEEASAVLEDVSVLVSGGCYITHNVGIAAYGHLELNNSLVSLTEPNWGGAAIVLFGTANLSHVTVQGGAAFWAGASEANLSVRHSDIEGDIYLDDFESFRLSHSRLAGSLDSEGGTLNCFSVHDADLNPLDENCQPIQ